MSSPIDLGTFDEATDVGQPFVGVPVSESLDTGGLDYTHMGMPYLRVIPMTVEPSSGIKGRAFFIF